MNGIYDYFFHDTNINIDSIKPYEITIVETLDNKFTIARLENGFTVIKINKSFLPLMNQYVDKYRLDLLSENALNFVKEHFRLNSVKNPWEYIYGITNTEELLTNTILDSTVKVELTSVIAMNPNRFEKYPFKNPNEKFIYFGTYINGELVSLVSGYLGDLKAVELTGETLLEHRNKGYAKSNTLAITEYLLSNGYEVVTTNGFNNKASIQTIKSLGFKRYGCQLAFYGI